MSDFLLSFLEIFKGFITAVSSFWEWFTTPLEALSVFGWELSPIMIFGFSTFIIVFVMVLVHLFNPIS